MEMSTVEAGLVWGAPVRPDLLGLHLEAYEKTLPTLNALRLCQRFGKGPDVYITRLPNELLKAVEDFIFDERLSRWSIDKGEWEINFRHFEGRCEPLDHLVDDYLDWFDNIQDEFALPLCHSCEENGAFPNDECEKGCEEMINLNINECLADDYAYVHDSCEGYCDAWTASIDQRPTGQFSKYDKILREHFGLEAYFAPTRASEETAKVWPSHPNHKWHDTDRLTTTICYLTRPKKLSGQQHYPASEMELDCGFIDVDSLQSCLIEPITYDGRDRMVKQFQRALRILKLKPYVHPSQLTTKVSPALPQGGGSPSVSEGSEAEKASRRAKELAKIEWPQLVMLVKSSFNLT